VSVVRLMTHVFWSAFDLFKVQREDLGKNIFRNFIVNIICNLTDFENMVLRCLSALNLFATWYFFLFFFIFPQEPTMVEAATNVDIVPTQR